MISPIPALPPVSQSSYEFWKFPDFENLEYNIPIIKNFVEILTKTVPLQSSPEN